MSSQRGNCAKSGSQKHQNTKAYRNDLHRKDKTIKTLNSLQITGCCKRCKEVIEWKIKYNKYKALTRPKKCVKCLQKSITNSYFIICQNCVESRNLCGKCALVPPNESSAEAPEPVETEINSKSKSASTKRKPDDEKDNSDYDDEDDSDLNNEVDQVLTLNDKAKARVSVKPNRVRTKEDLKSKNINMRKTLDKPKVTFGSSESGSESELDSEEEEIANGYEDKSKDDKTTSGDKKTDDEDKDKLSEDEERYDVNKSSSVKVLKENQSEDDEEEDDEEEGE